MPHDLLGLTLVELTETLRARKASPVELMEAVLARIDETHAGAQRLRRRCASATRCSPTRAPPRRASRAARRARSRASRSA